MPDRSSGPHPYTTPHKTNGDSGRKIKTPMAEKEKTL